MRSFLLVALLVTGCSSGSTAPTSKRTSQAAQAQVISAKLAPAVNAGTGQMGQEVIVTWENVGTTPIRVVNADIQPLDSGGGVIDTYNYTIYAEFNDAPGVQPGETFTTESGNGFRLPGFQPVSSVRVSITEAKTMSSL